MDLYIIIPAYNEEKNIRKTLDSLVNQSYKPKKIIVVDDNSTDSTWSIIQEYADIHPNIFGLKTTSDNIHLPGSKVVNAFKKGYETLDQDFDVICKFDSDLIFPTNYLKEITKMFEMNPKCGMAGGFCYILKDGKWVDENLTNKDHIRGAIKAYKKECFLSIGGLKSSMGWDTVDELLARYYGFEVCTNQDLRVKHLKPTGGNYSKAARLKQGEAFYKMRYGFKLSQLAALKLALRKKSPRYYFDCLQGYIVAKAAKLPFLVTKKEGDFIREWRWKNILKRIT